MLFVNLIRTTRFVRMYAYYRSDEYKKSATERSQKRRAEAKRLGICWACPRSKESPVYQNGMCEPHHTKSREYIRNRRERLQAAGYCSCCSEGAASPIYKSGRCRKHYEYGLNRALQRHRSGQSKEDKLRRMGTSIQEYEQLSKAQDQLCAICRRPNEGTHYGNKLCVDHDHKTGRFRGLLCFRCNTGIGSLRDDPAILRAAIQYLER